MSASELQDRLFADVESPTVEIETSGRVIRPIFAMIAQLVDECKMQCTEDGLLVNINDPASVGMVRLHVDPSAFERYEVEDELVTGINFGPFRKALTMARKGKATDDPVSLTLGDGRIVVNVEREYESTTLSRVGEVLTLDPNSIRPGHDASLSGFEYEATVDVDAFADAIAHIDSFGDFLIIETDGEREVTLAGPDAQVDPSEREQSTGVACLQCDVEHVGNGEKADGPAKFSIDYLRDMATGLTEGLVDDVTLRFAGEYPVSLAFERTIGEDVAYSGAYYLAPRISSGGEL